MIKKILLGSIIVAALFGIYILARKPLIHYLRVKQIENDVLNFLNQKSDKHISEEGKNIYNYITNIRNTECNISPLVERYFNILDGVLKSKYFGIPISDMDIKVLWFDERHNFYVNRVDLGDNLAGKEYIIIQNSLSDDDIINYNQNTFKTDLSKKLESVLIHKSDDTNNDWYMDSSQSKIIELPYNCYLEFNKGREVDFDITEQIYLNSEFIKCELEKTDEDFVFNDRGLTAKIVYKNQYGNIGNISVVIGLKNMGDYIMLTPHLEPKYIKYGNNPAVGLGSHDVDREKAKFDRLVEETNEVNRMIDIGYGIDIIKRVESVFESDLSYEEVWERINKLNDKFYEYRDVEGLDIETINRKLLEEWENN